MPSFSSSSSSSIKKKRQRERQLVQMYQMMQSGLDEIMNVTKLANELPQQILLRKEEEEKQKENTTRRNDNDDDDREQGINNDASSSSDQQMNEELIGGLFSSIENIHVVAYSLSRLIPPVNEVADVEFLEEEEEVEEEDVDIEQRLTEGAAIDESSSASDLPPGVSPLLAQLTSPSPDSSSAFANNRSRSTRRKTASENNERSASRFRSTFVKFGIMSPGSTAAAIARETGLEEGLTRRNLLYEGLDDELEEDDNETETWNDDDQRGKEQQTTSLVEGNIIADKDNEHAVDKNAGDNNISATEVIKVKKSNMFMMPKNYSLMMDRMPSERTNINDDDVVVSNNRRRDSVTQISREAQLDAFSSRIQQSAAAIRNLKMKLMTASASPSPTKS